MFDENKRETIHFNTKIVLVSSHLVRHQTVSRDGSHCQLTSLLTRKTKFKIILELFNLPGGARSEVHPNWPRVTEESPDTDWTGWAPQTS